MHARACWFLAFVPLQQVAAMTSVDFPPTRARARAHTLSLLLTSPVSAAVRFNYSCNPLIISGGHIAPLPDARARIRKDSHSHTHARRNTERWTDLIIQVEQLVLTEEQSTKKDTREKKGI